MKKADEGKRRRRQSTTSKVDEFLRAFDPLEPYYWGFWLLLIVIGALLTLFGL